jgi:hypothetical protein
MKRGGKRKVIIPILELDFGCNNQFMLGKELIPLFKLSMVFSRALICSNQSFPLIFSIISFYFHKWVRNTSIKQANTTCDERKERFGLWS